MQTTEVRRLIDVRLGQIALAMQRLDTAAEGSKEPQVLIRVSVAQGRLLALQEQLLELASQVGHPIRPS